MIQLKLIPVVIESAQRQVTEEFKSMILKPLYIDQTLNKNSSSKGNPHFRSDFDKCLNSVLCVIATQQEGYLYHFDDSGKIYNVLGKVLFILLTSVNIISGRLFYSYFCSLLHTKIGYIILYFPLVFTRWF